MKELRAGLVTRSAALYTKRTEHFSLQGRAAHGHQREVLVGIEKNLRKLAMKMRSKMPTRERVGSLWRLLLLPVGEARSAKDSRPNAVVSPALLLLVSVLMGLIALPGCGGCKGSGTSASAKKKSKNDEDKKKSDEEVLEELEKRKKKLE